MDLDIAKVVIHNLGHRPWASHHQCLPLPQSIPKAIPGTFEEFEARRQVGAEVSSRAIRSEVCG
jgi:hypothetical protein